MTLRLRADCIAQPASGISVLSSRRPGQDKQAIRRAPPRAERRPREQQSRVKDGGMRLVRSCCVAGLIAVAVGMSANPSRAGNDFTVSRPKDPAVALGTTSGLPVPRFVSLKSDHVNVRGGPTKDNEVSWIYTRSGLPVEITAEFENWRRIRDSEGSEGWVYHSLLSGKRTAVITTKSRDDLASLY